ncbi:metal-dependent phosphohydrolase [Chitinophaga sp.]|uniref:HD domain-containing protein n=1 Tax=Chitinophaga sp. TaxID=1869181 RepID=UPI0031E2AE70
MSEALLLAKIEAHVRHLFALHMQPYLYYHNLAHTEEVVEHTTALCSWYNLAAHNSFIIITAAWFHDTGHLFGDLEGHEERGAALMRQFLEGSVPTLYLSAIHQYIMATRMPVHPANIMEKIICDADTWHLGTADFMMKDAKVWQELEARKGRTFENKAALSLKFMQQHSFYTTYCKQQLSAGKRRNIDALVKITDIPNRH